MPFNKYPWTNEVLMTLLNLIKIQNYSKKDAYLDVKKRLLNIWRKSGLELISDNTVSSHIVKLYENYKKLADQRSHVMLPNVRIR